jgi:hypothetical protein
MNFLIPGLFLLAGTLGAPAIACGDSSFPTSEIDDTVPPVWFASNTHAFFGPCAGDCGAAVYGGREITTPMSSVFLIHNPTAPWNVETGDAGVTAAVLSRRFATLLGALDLAAEVGVDRRLGDMHATTGWLAVDFRWTRFPWNNILSTTIAFSDGPSMASEIDREERIRSQNGRGSDLLNFASPEITFALPDHPEDELVLRYQHRSGIFGLINGVDEASSFACIGYRRLF